MGSLPPRDGLERVLSASQRGWRKQQEQQEENLRRESLLLLSSVAASERGGNGDRRGDDERFGGVSSAGEPGGGKRGEEEGTRDGGVADMELLVTETGRLKLERGDSVAVRLAGKTRSPYWSSMPASGSSSLLSAGLGEGNGHLSGLSALSASVIMDEKKVRE